MFLRGSKLVWGVGLLTVTTAFLLDTLLAVFGRQAMLEELGFFFYVISGALFAGAAVWLFGLLRPLTLSETGHTGKPRVNPGVPQAASGIRPPSIPTDTAFDRQMVYEQIRDRMGPEDVLDLMFDLGINENEVMMPGQDMHGAILRIMDLAEQRGLVGSLALAVERILTPVPRENLPRLEKLDESSPPTVLRQYLLASYSMEELEGIAASLSLDWEQLDYQNKKSFVRTLLLYLYRRNRVDELVAVIKRPLFEEARQDEPD
jgi:hypothetical protein